MITVTRRALNMASLLCRDAWHEDRRLTGRGIVSWLEALAEAAAASGELIDGKTVYKGVRFHFKTEPEGVILVAVRPAKRTLDSIPNEKAESNHADTPTTK